MDKTICYKSRVDCIGEAPWGDVLKYYVDLFKKGSGNCRVA